MAYWKKILRLAWELKHFNVILQMDAFFFFFFSVSIYLRLWLYTEIVKTKEIQHVKWCAIAQIVLLQGFLWDHCLGQALSTGTCRSHLQQHPPLVASLDAPSPTPSSPSGPVGAEVKGSRWRLGKWHVASHMAQTSTTNTTLCTQMPELGHQCHNWQTLELVD